MLDRSAALVVIGNEILSGKVQDSNGYFTARELRSIGVELKRITVVADEREAIGEEVARCAKRYDIVITSGGVGPTPDDVTMEGIARAFGRKLVTHPELVRIIQEYASERANRASLKMAEVPEGAVLNDAGEIRFPTVQVENVFVLPGIPQLFEAKLKALRPRFEADPYFMRAIYTRAIESAVAEHLDATLAMYPKLLLGSYPRIGDAEYRVKLTLESKDPDYLERAFHHLIGLLPGETVVRVE